MAGTEGGKDWAQKMSFNQTVRHFFICTFTFLKVFFMVVIFLFFFSFSPNLFFYLCFSSVPSFHPSFQRLAFPHESQFTGPNSPILQSRSSAYPALSLPPFDPTYFQPLLIFLQAPACLSDSLDIPLPDLCIRIHLLSSYWDCVPQNIPSASAWPFPCALGRCRKSTIKPNPADFPLPAPALLLRGTCSLNCHCRWNPWGKEEHPLAGCLNPKQAASFSEACSSDWNSIPVTNKKLFSH